MDQGQNEWDGLVSELVARRANRAGRDDLSPDTGLADLGIDSLGVVALIIDLEAALGRQFPEEALSAENFRTLRSIGSAVARLMAPTQPSGRQAPPQSQPA